MRNRSRLGLREVFERLFPPRQFYLRSKGAVSFFEISAGAQIGLVCIALVLPVWTAYSSVVVIFKEQIALAQHQRISTMQSAYEERISKMQLAYDALNAELVISEERYRNATADLEGKNRNLTALFMNTATADRRAAR